MKNTVILSIEAKRAMLDIIKEMLEKLDYLENDNTCEYGVIGTSDRQRKQLRRDENGEVVRDAEGNRCFDLVFDEDGEPEYEDEYGYLEYNPETATESQKAYKSACDQMRRALEKMI